MMRKVLLLLGGLALLTPVIYLGAQPTTIVTQQLITQVVDYALRAAPPTQAGACRVYADSTANALKYSCNGGAYATLSGGGTVTNIATTSPITGGPITTTGTIGLSLTPTSCTTGTAVSAISSSGVGTCGATTAPTILQYFLAIQTPSAGGGTSVVLNSRTVKRIGIVFIPGVITINQVSFIGGSVLATPGTAKFCMYTEDGQSKVLDVTSGTVSVINTNVSVTVSPAVTIGPGYFFVAIGAVGAGTSIGAYFWTTASTNFYNNTAIPAGKYNSEGTITMAQDVCDSSFTPSSAITGAVNATLTGLLAN